MFLMTYLKFASNILSLDMGSFENIYIVIVLGGKRLLWKPMGNDLVYSSPSSQAKVPILVYSYLHLGVKCSECNAICRMSFKFDDII